MSEMLTGTIASLKIARSTDKWDTYEIAFNDGSVEKVAHARDQKPLEVGDVIECSKGKWDWLTKSVSSNGNGKHSTAGGGERAERPHREEGEKKSYTPPVKTTSGQREDYWQHKAEYEELQRDPKIEFQSYFAQVIALYCAAVPSLNPASVEELDGMVDQAYDKAKAIMAKINAKNS